MKDSGYNRIVEALEEGRRALFRARLTAGALRFLGVALATLAGLVLWAILQRALRMYSVPVAAVASLLGAGIAVFALVRWVVLPLVRMPGRDAFVSLIERRFPAEKNLIVNAYQLGNPPSGSQGGDAPDLVEAVVHRASERVRNLDLHTWRDPAPDRPYLWAGGASLLAMGLLALLAPGLLGGALGQVIRPGLAEPPPVHLTVLPGDVEVDRGSDVDVSVDVDGTDHAPVLQFRERQGVWRNRSFEAASRTTRDGGNWKTVLPRVDRYLEYRVDVRRARSPVFAIQVRETPRLAGFQASMTYPAYTGLPTETLNSGTGDLAALKGTDVDLRILTNRTLASGYLDWRGDDADSSVRIPLAATDPTTWKADLRLMDPASYAVVLLDAEGHERLRSPRYRVDPAPDRLPHLTLLFPQDDHDLANDMMERIVADAADDYGFSGVSVRYRVDEGPEKAVSYRPYTAGQKEFRLDTLWDLSGLNLVPGAVVSYYVEVRDNDTVTGPKAVRSPVRRVRFPTVADMYKEVTEDHNQEIDSLSDLHSSQEDLRQRLEKLDSDLKRGREVDWQMRQDVDKAASQQVELQKQLSDAVERLSSTLDKAANRAQMSYDLVQKMQELNDILQSLSNDDLKRSFRELSRALDTMDRDAIRRALENLQNSQEQMLRGMDRTVELLKQIRRDEQMADVVERSDEIARLQREIARELEKLGMKQPPPQEASRNDVAQNPESETGDRNPEAKDAENLKNPAGKPDRPEAMDQADRNRDASKQGDEAKDRLSDQERQDETTDRNQAGEPKTGENQDQKSQDQKSQAGQNQQSQNSQDQQNQQQNQQGQENQAGQNQQSQDQKPSPQNSGEPQSQASPQEQQRLDELAKKQEDAQAKLEELKRLLRQLQKLNDEKQDMAQNLSDLEKSDLTRSLEQSMKQAQQGMSQGKKGPTAYFTFKARDEANRLADKARGMQQQMSADQQNQNVEKVENVIKGLIDVSGVQETLSRSQGEDTRLLAQRQSNLVEVADAISDSLQEIMKQSFAVGDKQQSALDKALRKMTVATNLFEQGNRVNADHQARESASDLNETIVQLMQSHDQMCGGKSGGDAQAKMQGLTDGQRGLNQSTRQLMERLAAQNRLSMTDAERMRQLAAQQEMIRQGLQDLQQQMQSDKKLLGDMDQLAQDMKDVEQDLTKPKVDPKVVDRQEKILSRLLDAQRSVRQREMSLQRQSKTATLADRTSPPPLPESLLRKDRTLEEDVLRGANDRYPAQYRKLVEEYFRALSRENRAP